MMRRGGAKIDDIARSLNINPDSFYKYKNEYAELSEALKDEELNLYDRMAEIAENSLFTNLEDRWVDAEVVTETWFEGDPKKPRNQRSKVTKKKALWRADKTAIIFALKNRNPDNWKDRTETEITGNLNVSQIEQYLSGKDDVENADTNRQAKEVPRLNKD
jgi:hypothetical protein